MPTFRQYQAQTTQQIFTTLENNLAALDPAESNDIDNDLSDLLSSAPINPLATNPASFFGTPQNEHRLHPSRTITGHSNGSVVADHCNYIIYLLTQTIFNAQDSDNAKKTYLHRTLLDATRSLKHLTPEQAKEIAISALIEAENNFDQGFVLVPEPTPVEFTPEELDEFNNQNTPFGI